MELETPKCDLVAHKIVEHFKGETYAFTQQVLKLVNILIEHDLRLYSHKIDGIEIHRSGRISS